MLAALGHDETMALGRDGQGRRGAMIAWVGGEGHCVPPMRCTCTACSESHGHTLHDGGVVWAHSPTTDTVTGRETSRAVRPECTDMTGLRGGA